MRHLSWLVVVAVLGTGAATAKDGAKCEEQKRQQEAARRKCEEQKRQQEAAQRAKCEEQKRQQEAARRECERKKREQEAAQREKCEQQKREQEAARRAKQEAGCDEPCGDCGGKKGLAKCEDGQPPEGACACPAKRPAASWPLTEEELLALKQRYDMDKDGTLNDEERGHLRNHLKEREAEAREAQRQAKVARFDVDGDGELNEDEAAHAQQVLEQEQREALAAKKREEAARRAAKKPEGGAAAKKPEGAVAKKPEGR